MHFHIGSKINWYQSYVGNENVYTGYTISRIEPRCVMHVSPFIVVLFIVLYFFQWTIDLILTLPIIIFKINFYQRLHTLSYKKQGYVYWHHFRWPSMAARLAELMCYHAHKWPGTRNMKQGQWVDVLSYILSQIGQLLVLRSRNSPNNGKLMWSLAQSSPLYRTWRNSFAYSMTFRRGKIDKCPKLLLIIKTGDVKLNSGSRLPNFPCIICRKGAKWTPNCPQCNLCQGWYDAQCLGMPESLY